MPTPARPIIDATRRLRRALEELGIHCELILSHLDGEPLSTAEVAACARVVAEFDAQEAREERAPRSG